MDDSTRDAVRVCYNKDAVRVCYNKDGAALVAAFLNAVVDAACDRSQSCFPLHVLLPTSALHRLLDPLSAPPSPVASRVTMDASCLV